MGQYRIIAKVYDENDNEILSDDCFIDPTESVTMEFDFIHDEPRFEHVGTRPRDRE